MIHLFFSKIIPLVFFPKVKKSKKWVVQPKTRMKGVPRKLEKRNRKTLMCQAGKSTNSNWSGRMGDLGNYIFHKKKWINSWRIKGI